MDFHSKEFENEDDMVNAASKLYTELYMEHFGQENIPNDQIQLNLRRKADIIIKLTSTLFDHIEPWMKRNPADDAGLRFSQDNKVA